MSTPPEMLRRGSSSTSAPGREGGRVKERVVLRAPAPVQGGPTCDGLTVDAPGDGGRGDAFSLTVQAHGFSRGVEPTGRLPHPVGGSYDHNTTLLLRVPVPSGPADVDMLTFHGHGEGVHAEAVGVPRIALVLAVIVQADALEVEPAVVLVRLPTGVQQTPILLLPLHLGRGSVETDQSREG